MNHLEALTAEWLAYNGYFVRTAVRVGRLPHGGWAGELDVVALHPKNCHFLHVECSIDADSWSTRDKRFRKKLECGKRYAPKLFDGLNPPKIEQVIVLGFAAAPNKHRDLGGGRLVTHQELIIEILNSVPPDPWKNAVPESFPLIRTVQLVRKTLKSLPESASQIIRPEATQVKAACRQRR